LSPRRIDQVVEPDVSRVITLSQSVHRLPIWQPACQTGQVGFDVTGGKASDYSGRSVAMSAGGKRIAISAFSNDNNMNSENSAHVRIVDFIGSTWTQLGSDIDGEAEYGYSVAIAPNGKRIAIGAIGNDDNGVSSGHVRVYDLIGRVGDANVC
jgi:hypothetical protein